MPLSMLFGPEALQYRLQDSEAVVAICDATSLEALSSVRDDCPLLRSVIGVGGGPKHEKIEVFPFRRTRTP
jgi:acetyl-CoA synthetase